MFHKPVIGDMLDIQHLYCSFQETSFLEGKHRGMQRVEHLLVTFSIQNWESNCRTL